ncbi:hypothetical protein ACQEU8_00045 [Streptomyces sp. CA-250714]|uniref:hypothetical protein n=1 Tax=Streptomyces sp. CA-250714 TaxID=3240060 RepID=UPI003D9301BE
MSTWSMLAGLGAALVVLGVCGAIAVGRGWSPALRGRGLRHRGQRAMDELPPRWRDNYRYLLVAAAVAGVGMWVWTGWPIHGLMTAGALAGLPFLLHPGGSAQRRIARLDALGAVAAPACEYPHRRHLAGADDRRLGRPSTHGSARAGRRAAAVRLQQGVTPREVYALLADDLGDTAGDEVALLLMEHAEGRGTRLCRRH